MNGDGIVSQLDDDIRFTNVGMSATTLTLLADRNGDWKVDYSDLDIMVRNLDLPNPGREDGDLNRSGYISLDDAHLLVAQLGLALSIIPEPNTYLFLSTALSLLSLARLGNRRCSSQ